MPVIMEDEIIHTDAHPFCNDPECPCHTDNDLFDEYIMEPMLAGLMTSFEANRLRWGEYL